MSAMRYKIWQWGEEARQGTCEAYNVGLTTRAKRADKDQRFIVANEMIALRLGAVLGLPIPDGVVIERDGEPYFASMNFNIEGFNLPPADPAAIIRDVAELAAGVVVFDIWIVNKDRHAGNLHYDGTKKDLYVIDHSHALFEHDGISRLRNMKDNIGIGAHCLLSGMETLASVEDWVSKVRQIPSYYIRNAVLESVPLGVPIEDVNEYTDFLIERPKRIVDLIRANRNYFPCVSDLFFKWEAPAEVADAYCI